MSTAGSKLNAQEGGQMSNIVSVSDIERMANAVAKSGLFGIKTPEQAMALMLIAQAEGLHPAIAARDYHVIQGRPSLKADAMLARFQTAGGKVRWTEYTEKRVAGVFSHAAGGEVEIDWTIDKAKSLGFLSGDNWKNYPRAMLRARCISEGVRTVFPGVVVGTYTPEELEDTEPAKPIRDMGTAEVVHEPAQIEEATIAIAEISEDVKNDVHDRTLMYLQAGDAVQMKELWKAFGADEHVALWKLFNSRQRSAIKELIKNAEA